MIESLQTVRPETIRRSIPIPLHYQLSELLQQEIEAGRWKVGERIPTEEELCAHFKLSRTTVRKGLDSLVNSGLLRREKARGTFIAEPKLVEGLVNSPTGFFDDMHRQGIKIETRVLDIRQTQPSATVAKELALGPKASVIAIERLRLVRNQPILIVTSFVPYKMCPNLLKEDLRATGLYTLLREKYEMNIVRAKRFLEAVAANEYEAEMLGLQAGAPLMLIESTTYLDDGRPIDYFRARHRGDLTRFIVESFKYASREHEATNLRAALQTL